MRSTLRILILGAFAPLAFGQTAQAPPASTGSVEGTVVNAGTREPLKKAWVTMRIEGGQAPGTTLGNLTDATGRFALKNVEPGRYHLSAERNGFVRQMYGQEGPDSPGTILNISPGQAIRDIQVAMIPSAVISGRVYDDDSEAVVNAGVSVLRFIYHEGKRELRPAGFAQTNDLGEFRIFGLAPGSYFISATFAGWGRPPLAGGANTASKGSPDDEMGFAPTYYPGSNDLARAIPVEVRAGEELPGLDINLLSTRAVRVRGRIISPVTGKGEARAWVRLMQRESKVRSFTPAAQTGVNNPQGEFEFRGVVPGNYTLVANSFTGEDRYQARIPLDVGPSDIDGLIVPLGKGAEVHGRVRWEGGDPEGSNAKARVGLMPREETILMWGSMQRELNPDGSFVLKNFADGEYRVQIDGAPEDCYLRSALLGGEDILASGVSISGGRVSGSLEIGVNCAGGILEGSVVNDQLSPVSGVTVVLIPDTERRTIPHLFKASTADQYGRFTIKGIAPGEYKAFAWDKIESGAYQDPEFLRRYEGEGKPVTVGEGGRLSVQLTLISAEKPPE